MTITDFLANLPGVKELTAAEMLAIKSARFSAESLALQIHMAATTHAEVLRDALASLFDLEGIDERCKRVQKGIHNLEQCLFESMELLGSIEEQFRLLEARFDACDALARSIEDRLCTKNSEK